MEAPQRALQSLLIPERVAGWAEEHRALIAVDTMDLAASSGQIGADLGADETGRTGHETDSSRHGVESGHQGTTNFMVERLGSRRGAQ